MIEKSDHGQATVTAATLYVVATPLGNLSDITLRALAVLKQVDVVAAEDTRLTGQLLRHYGIATTLSALHEHNEQQAAAKLVQWLAQGKSVALVSDAGTPAISDPGARAVAAVRAAGYQVVPIPGASAVTAALSAAGHPAPHYLFYGFLPATATARRRALAAMKALPYLLVFFEAPHRVVASVKDMASELGPERNIIIARELTKMFESWHGCPLSEAAAWLAADDNRIKGEFVLLVDGADSAMTAETAAVHRTLEVLLRELPLKQAVKLASEISGARKNEVYELALQLKRDG
jgi:16S rRNA (cytidine1402-2'-O)-methyltransferase